MEREKRWTDLSPEEKRRERFNRWLSPPGVKFISQEAEKNYKARVTRFIRAIQLEEPDRVPVILPSGFFPAQYAGVSLKTVMYDYDELRWAWLKFLNDFEMDSFTGPSLVFPGRMIENIDYRLYYWPGHGLADHISTYQYVEGEYMKAEEYADFIRDPVDFTLRILMSRTMGAFKGFVKLNPLAPYFGNPISFITQFSDPEIQESVKLLLNASLEGLKWQNAIKEINQAILEAGVPLIRGSMSSAPFDLIGDTLRGTKGIMMDMYQRPDKLIEAMERITPMVIESTVRAANLSECPVVFMPLHKGPGGFMSNKQFETFYWPTLKKVMIGLIEDGLVPFPFAEGDYLPRLEVIKDMPRAKVIWYFEAMDMEKAKKVLGDNSCIAGNLPVSLLCTGTSSEVKETCRRLIETCAQGGGYILTASAGMNEGNPENLKAMMDAAKEYGVYKR